MVLEAGGGINGAQIYRQVHPNEQFARDMHDGAAVVQELRTEHEEASVELETIIRSLNDSWRGDAAEAATAELDVLRKASGDVAERNYEPADGGMDTQSGSHTGTRHTLRPMEDGPKTADPILEHLGLESQEEYQRQWEEDNRHNIEVYEAYHTTTDANLTPLDNDFPDIPKASASSSGTGGGIGSGALGQLGGASGEPARSTYAETGTSSSDRGSSQPSSGRDSYPGSAPADRAQPGEPVTQQSGVQRLPDGTLIYPDGTRVLPGGTRILPDGTRVLPDGTRILPDGSRVLPDGSRVLPDGRIIPPGMTTAAGAGTPSVFTPGGGGLGSGGPGGGGSGGAPGLPGGGAAGGGFGAAPGGPGALGAGRGVGAMPLGGGAAAAAAGRGGMAGGMGRGGMGAMTPVAAGGRGRGEDEQEHKNKYVKPEELDDGLLRDRDEDGERTFDEQTGHPVVTPVIGDAAEPERPAQPAPPQVQPGPAPAGGRPLAPPVPAPPVQVQPAPVRPTPRPPGA